ncbi:MAG TPA: phytanoyl-CoA dioxygenase family protein [Phenylobacterium sp.]
MADAGGELRLDVSGHIEALRRDGYTIVEGLMSADQVERARTALSHYLGRFKGRNDFEGRTTERVYTLVARDEVFQEVAEDPRLMEILGAFLRPKFLLTASQAICIYPGEVAQRLHTDDSFYPIPRPRPAISLTVIYAVDAFTADNGGTVVVPGSHEWGDDVLAHRRAVMDAGLEAPFPVPPRSTVMPSGSALIMLGTLFHGGGANASDAPRLAFTNQYCEPWARPQENFFLGIPQETVRSYSPKLRELLGYEMIGTIMGQITGSHPQKSLQEGWTPPVVRQAQDD